VVSRETWLTRVNEQYRRAPPTPINFAFRSLAERCLHLGETKVLAERTGGPPGVSGGIRGRSEMPPAPGSAEAMLDLYNQGKAPGGVSMTIEEFLKWTDLGIMSRRSEQMRGIDNALRNYHAMKGDAASLQQLKHAFDRWIEFQQRQGKVWKNSDRNQKGAITDLFDQMNLAIANSKGPGRSKEELEGIQAIIEAERGALTMLFMNRQMLFKNTTKAKEQGRMVASPLAKAANAGRKLEDVGAKLVNPGSVKDACTQILGGTPPDTLFHALGHGTFTAFCSSASSILGAAVSPGKLLVDIVKFGMAASTRYSAANARYMFRAGAAEASLNAVLQMIDDELTAIALDAAKQTGAIVASAFGAGPIASAAAAVVDLMVNIKAYRGMMKEMEAANRLLQQKAFGLEIFNASPVAGCYFLLMADTSMWINFSMHDIGMKGWMDEVDVMRKRAEPVREKARELIRKSKIAMSGTEGFNGLEWEPSWRNNKREFFTSGQAMVALKNKAMTKLGSPPPSRGGVAKPAGPAKADIYGMGPGGRTP
jgi:hypothetical protein